MRRQPDNPLCAGDLLIYPNLGEPIRTGPAPALRYYAVVVPGAGPAPQTTVEVLQGGQVLVQAPVTLPGPDATGRIAYLGQLRVDTLPTGDYTLRLTVVQGDRRERRDAAFHKIE